MTALHETAPNPQFVRQQWIDLTGIWQFRYDDANIGLQQRWWAEPFRDDAREIFVPYPPESELSGIGDTSFHPWVWYQRELPTSAENAADRTLIRFGAVDYDATVWINDVLVGSHSGGSSPFVIDIETAWLRSLDAARLTLRVHDDPTDLEQPRGKQGWEHEPTSIWYKRTTGIWQPVWLETAPATHLLHAKWVFDADAKAIIVELELSRTPERPEQIHLTVFAPDGSDVNTTIVAEERLARAVVPLPEFPEDGGLAAWLWSPASPTLLPTRISTASGDVVDGYIGLRTVSLDRNGFHFNGHRTWLRLVLSQGYFADSLYAAPSAEALRREVEVTLALGFNGARNHQKAEDPRYLYWADRLGLLLWGEIGAAQRWSDRAFNRLANEWTELVRRDQNHPSIIAWTPFNESWGIWQVAENVYQQHGVRAIYDLTKSIDATRPVIGNDGWEHVKTDIFSLHDYHWEGAELGRRYNSDRTNTEVASTYDVANKVAVAALEGELNTLPIMITEYGGVSYAPDEGDAWFGYGKVTTEAEYIAKYDELTSALQQSGSLIGFCYTQLTDTEQETNGLLTVDREPKVDLEQIAAITRRDPFAIDV